MRHLVTIALLLTAATAQASPEAEVLAALGPRPVLVTSTADPAELLHAALAYRSGK